MYYKDWKTLGAFLKQARIARDLSAYRVAKYGNIQVTQVKAIEEGESNYTIDSLLGYLYGCSIRLDFEVLRVFKLQKKRLWGSPRICII